MTLIYSRHSTDFRKQRLDGLINLFRPEFSVHFVEFPNFTEVLDHRHGTFNIRLESKEFSIKINLSAETYLFLIDVMLSSSLPEDLPLSKRRASITASGTSM